MAQSLTVNITLTAASESFQAGIRRARGSVDSLTRSISGGLSSSFDYARKKTGSIRDTFQADMRRARGSVDSLTRSISGGLSSSFDYARRKVGSMRDTFRRTAARGEDAFKRLGSRVDALRSA